MGSDTFGTDATAIALVAAGGALGTYARYGTELVLGGDLLPTLAGNVAGCFLLGLLLFDDRAARVCSRPHRLVFGTGFCASFTTYSTFALDAATTATTSPALAVGYVASSYALGISAVLVARLVLATVGAEDVEPPSTPEGEQS